MFLLRILLRTRSFGPDSGNEQMGSRRTTSVTLRLLERGCNYAQLGVIGIFQIYKYGLSPSLFRFP